MGMAMSLKKYLEDAGVAYETVAHPRTVTSSETAQAAHVPGDSVAKSVLVHQEEGYLLAVVPSSRRVDLRTLQDVIQRRMGLATEDEIETIFDDCDTGAMPPIGAAYGLPALIDTTLDGHEAIWFEGGDHRTLVKISGRDFDRLTRDCQHAEFSCRV